MEIIQKQLLYTFNTEVTIACHHRSGKYDSEVQVNSEPLNYFQATRLF